MLIHLDHMPVFVNLTVQAFHVLSDMLVHLEFEGKVLKSEALFYLSFEESTSDLP